MSKENIFDLSKFAPAINDIEVKNNSTGGAVNDDNFELVDKAQWDKLPIRTYIKYLRTDGTMRKGGYIKTIWRTKDLEGNDSIKIDLVNNLSNSANGWSIYANNIQKLWKKINTDIEITHSVSSTDIDDVKEDISICKESINLIKIQLQKISTEQMRTITLIKKLHKIP